MTNFKFTYQPTIDLQEKTILRTLTTEKSKKSACSNYRFGFNGQEKDDEVFGSTGTSYNFKFRMYDSRIGRFNTIDPLAKKYPYWTPYQFAGNNPIKYMELEGKEPGADKLAMFAWDVGRGKIDKQTAKDIEQKNFNIAMGGIQNLAIVIGLLDPFTSAGTISTLITTPLAITSAGLTVGKTIAKANPNTFNQSKVEKAPSTGTGAVSMGVGAIVGLDPYKSGKTGDVIESMIFIYKGMESEDMKNIPLVISSTNTVLNSSKDIFTTSQPQDNTNDDSFQKSKTTTSNTNSSNSTYKFNWSWETNNNNNNNIPSIPMELDNNSTSDNSSGNGNL